MKAIGDPFDVSDQYSFDNLESNSHHGNEDEGLVTTEVEVSQLNYFLLRK